MRVAACQFLPCTARKECKGGSTLTHKEVVPSGNTIGPLNRDLMPPQQTTPPPLSHPPQGHLVVELLPQTTQFSIAYAVTAGRKARDSASARGVVDGLTARGARRRSWGRLRRHTPPSPSSPTPSRMISQIAVSMTATVSKSKYGNVLGCLFVASI